MRNLIVAASALALAAPASAQPYPEPPDDEILRELPPPGEIAAMGDALGRVADAIMDVDVGPVIDAVDPGRRHPRDRTLGDIASRDDPYARERVRDSIGAAAYGLEVAVEQIAVLTPVLRRSLEDAARRMDDAMRGRRRGDRDDYPRPDDHYPRPNDRDDR